MLKLMDFVVNMIDFVVNMMDFVVNMMEFVLIMMENDGKGACSLLLEELKAGENKMMNFVFKTRNCLSKTMNFVFEMMDFAGGNEVLAEVPPVAICVYIMNFVFKILKMMNFVVKLMNSVFKMMSFVLKMMNFVFQMMNFVLEMMSFAFQMMNFVLKMINRSQLSAIGRSADWCTITAHRTAAAAAAASARPTFLTPSGCRRTDVSKSDEFCI